MYARRGGEDLLCIERGEDSLCMQEWGALIKLSYVIIGSVTELHHHIRHIIYARQVWTILFVINKILLEMWLTQHLLI